MRVLKSIPGGSRFHAPWGNQLDLCDSGVSEQEPPGGARSGARGKSLLTAVWPCPEQLSWELGRSSRRLRLSSSAGLILVGPRWGEGRVSLREPYGPAAAEPGHPSCSRAVCGQGRTQGVKVDPGFFRLSAWNQPYSSGRLEQQQRPGWWGEIFFSLSASHLQSKAHLPP